MIFRIERSETATVVYSIRIFPWSFACVFYYITELFELTAIPYFYRKYVSHKTKPSLMEWLVSIQWFWCRRDVYKAGTRITLIKRRLTPGYIRYVRGF